jgi:mitochondrial import inner membrane translocase subunit TIM21
MNMSVKARAFQLACRARAAQSPSSSTRLYATQSTSSSSPTPHRRAITVTTDDGRYNWSDLSLGEKAARSTQQSINFLLVAAGLTGTCLVSYFLYQELFAPDSKTVQFNHAADRIKADPQCRELLGPSRKIVAYGEPTSSKWARARPLAYNSEVDRLGTTHFRMHFNVTGPKARGVVNVHMTKPKDESRLEYTLLSLNVLGHEVVYLENKETQGVKGKVGKMFGVQWR